MDQAGKLTTFNAEDDAFRRYDDLLRTIGLSTTEDMIHPMRTWLVCRIGVPEPVERYFLQGFHRWHVEWIEVIGVEGLVLPSDPVPLSLQTIVGLTEEPRTPAGRFGQGAAALMQWGAVTLIELRSFFKSIIIHR